MKKRILRNFLNINILLVLSGIIILLFITQPCTAQNQANVAGYTTLIQQADQALAIKDYPAALLLYEKAKHV
jgi:hypothetical protein